MCVCVLFTSVLVAGLIEAVGKDLFHQKATLTLLSQGQEQVGDSKSLYHAVLKVTVRARTHACVCVCVSVCV